MNRKQSLRAVVMVMEGMEIVPIILHLYSNSGDTDLSPLSPYDSLIMPNMWHFSW